jgi:putative hemolysin
MHIAPGIGLLAVVVLVILNGFFVATEFAIVAVRRSRLEQLVQEGRTGAAAAKDLVAHLDAYIAACQLGITMASLGLGWIGEPAVASLVARPLAAILGEDPLLAAHGITVGLSFALITALHIVIGELAPKGIALQRPEATTLLVALPMRVFYRLFKWPIGALNAVGNGVLRLFGLQVSTGHEMVHTAEELRLLVNASHEAGVVEESEARIAARAFQFADLTAGELMKPRTDVVAVSVDDPLDAVIDVARAARHSRLPVYGETLDDIVGVLHVAALLDVTRAPASFNLRTLATRAAFIPTSRKADDALEDMRRGGFHLAVVVDEYGVTAGILTFHDIMQGLVGRVARDGSRAIGRPQADGSRTFDGLVRLAELEEILELKLPQEDREAADTLNGLVMLRLGRLPQVGDTVDLGEWLLTVESVAHQRVGRACMKPKPASSPQS